MTSLLPFPELQFFANDGTPLALGTVETYIIGTLSAKVTYQNDTGTVANTNPVVLNAAGRGIFYGGGGYRFIVRDALGNLIYDQDTASTLPESAISAVMLPVCSAATLATARDLMGITKAINDAVATAATLTGPTGHAGATGATGPTGATGASGGGGGSLDRQFFGASGTWHKPAGGSIAIIQLWGAGGAGAEVALYGSDAGPGGGGGYTCVACLLSDLSSTVTVTVGAGGVFTIGGGIGGNGGNTSFGSFLVQAGGKGGYFGSNSIGTSGYLLSQSGVNIIFGSQQEFTLNPDRSAPPAYPQTYDGFGNQANSSAFAGTPGSGYLGSNPVVWPSIFGGTGGTFTGAGAAPGGGGSPDANGAAGQVIVTVV